MVRSGRVRADARDQAGAAADVHVLRGLPGIPLLRPEGFAPGDGVGDRSGLPTGVPSAPGRRDHAATDRHAGCPVEAGDGGQGDLPQLLSAVDVEDGRLIAGDTGAGSFRPAFLEDDGGQAVRGDVRRRDADLTRQRNRPEPLPSGPEGIGADRRVLGQDVRLLGRPGSGGAGVKTHPQFRGIDAQDGFRLDLLRTTARHATSVARWPRPRAVGSSGCLVRRSGMRGIVQVYAECNARNEPCPQGFWLVPDLSAGDEVRSSGPRRPSLPVPSRPRCRPCPARPSPSPRPPRAASRGPS